MDGKTIGRWSALTLALVLIITLGVAYINADDQAYTGSASSGDSSGVLAERITEEGDIVGPSGPGPVMEFEEPPGYAEASKDVACIPKETYDAIGTNQPDPSQPPPQGGPNGVGIPPPPLVPGIDDEVTGEEGESIGTNRDFIEGLEQNSPKKNDAELKAALKEAKDTGKIPGCKEEGDWKGADPGAGGLATKFAEENGYLDSSVAAEEPSEEIKAQASAIVDGLADQLGASAVQAQDEPWGAGGGNCFDGQPVAIVQAGTTHSASDVASLTRAVDSQLWNDLGPDWWCAYAYYAPNYTFIGEGSWPIFMCGGDSCPGDFGATASGNYHAWSPWPFGPNTYAPWGQVVDTDTGGSIDLWSSITSHESIEIITNPYPRGDNPNTEIDERSGWYTTALGAYFDIPYEFAGYAWEAADPVFPLTMGYNVADPQTSHEWRLSDYVLPKWFHENSGGDPPWDQVGEINSDNGWTPGPFQAACAEPGAPGYIVYIAPPETDDTWERASGCPPPSP